MLLIIVQPKYGNRDNDFVLMIVLVILSLVFRTVS